MNNELELFREVFDKADMKRRNACITVSEMAALLHINQRHYYKVRNGERKVSKKLYLALINFVNS